MKTLFRVFNVMFFAAALVFAGASMVFAAPRQNSTIDWCALCQDGKMWDPYTGDCIDCGKDGTATYDLTTCACSCNDPMRVYVPGSGCVPSFDWCSFNCKEGVWDPVTHTCSGDCGGEGQYYDEKTCGCACDDGVYNPTTQHCEPDPKLCNGKCSAPEFWNEDTKKCEMCVSIPGVSYYDPGACQCRCTQEGYEYDAKTGTCVAEQSYTVSFEANGGTGGQSTNVAATYGQAMPAISTTAPTRTGYTFTGWYDAANGGTRYYDADGTSARNWDKTTDATLYAHWTAKTSTISFNANNGSGGQSTNVTATYGQAMPAISTTAPTRTGYTFAGWYDNATSGTKYYNANGTSAGNWDKTTDATLYAHWTANTYTISYSLNNGTHGASHPTSATYGTSFTVSNPTRSGYVFSGWKITGMDSVTHTYGDSTTTSNSISSTTATTFNNLRSTSGTVTFTAQWTSGAYTVTLNDNGGTGGNGAVYTTQGTGVYIDSNHQYSMLSPDNYTVPIPTKVVGNQHYAFLGYYGVQIGDEAGLSTYPLNDRRWIDATGHITADGEQALKNGVSGNGVVLYARYTSVCHPMDIDNSTYCGSSVVAPMLYGKSVQAPAGGGMYVTRYQYYDNVDDCLTSNTGISSFPGAVLSSDVIKANSTYTGHNYMFQAANFPVFWDNNGVFDNFTEDYGWGSLTYAICTCNPGWQGTTCTSVTNAGCITTSACTEGVTVTLDHSGGASSGGNEIYTRKGTTSTGGLFTNFTRSSTTQMTTSANPVSVPTRENYTFDGYWSAASGGTKYIGTDGKLTSAGLTAGVGYGASTPNVTWYAHWTANTYTVSFNANGGTGGQSTNVTATYGSAMPAISTTAPTLAGYTFAGWYDASTGGTKYYNANGTSARNWDKTANTTLYAQWTANTYTVSFNANGGTGGQSTNVTATYGQAMPAISTTAPTYAGYTFKGWYDNTTGGMKYYNANGTSARSWDKTANTTLYAQWTQDAIECSVGQYYNATSNECATCVAGSYCPGGTLAMGQGNQGIYSCPAAPAYNANTMPWNSSTTATSDAGAGAITECYLAWLPAGCLAQLNAGWNYAGYVLPNVLYSENVKVYCSSAGTYPTGNQYIVPARLLAQPGYEVNQANTYTAPNGSTVTNPWTPPSTKAYYGILGKSCSKCSAGAYSVGGGQMRWQSGTLVENAVCRSCPTGWPNSSAGSDAITKCYSNTKSRAWTGTQETCSNPDATGCSGATCGTCSNEACSYVAYVNSAGDADGAIKSGCSENNAACTQPVTALTANEGYHIESGNLNYCPANTYTVTFNANGGTGAANPTSVTCAYDQNCTLAAKGTLSKTNATFDGWNTASNGTGTSYLESDVVQNLTSTNGANVTLYAVWRTSGCSAGKYLVDGVCVSCPAGYSCAGGSALPVMCPTNKYSTGGAASCSSCTNGLTTSSVADARYHDEAADCGRVLHIGAYEIRLKSIPSTGTLSSLVPSPSLRFNYAGNANGRPDFYANMSTVASPMRVTATGEISTAGTQDKFKTKYNNINYYVCDDVTCVTE